MKLVTIIFILSLVATIVLNMRYCDLLIVGFSTLIGQ